jgi:prevent-host-death family protein
MHDIALYDAKNRLSELIHRVEAGEEIAITRRGKVVARLVGPAAAEGQHRALQAVEALRSTREGVSLGTLRSADLIRSGRR